MLDQIRLRSAKPNADLEINRISSPHENFVHILLTAHEQQPIEIHFPIEWVSIDTDDNMVFNSEAHAALNYARQIAERSVS